MAAGLRDPYLMALALVTALYLALVLPAVPVHGISNDELIDLRIATAYAEEPGGWLIGRDRDLSQARLPMYATALVSTLVGHPSLLASRLLSCLYGVLTIWGVFCFCRLELDQTKGLIAASILAVSPYYLAFSKVAMTEGDSLVACTGVWFVLAAMRLTRRSDVGSCALAAIAGGITVAAKVPAAVWLLAAGLCFLVLRASVARSPEAGRRTLVLGMIAVVGLVAVLAGWLVASPDLNRVNLRYHQQPLGFVVAHAAAVLLCWCAFAALAWRWGRTVVSWWCCMLLVGLGSLLTFFAIPPVHTTNPGVVEWLFRMYATNQQQLTEQSVYSAAVFHFLVMLVKPGVIVGSALWGAVAVAIFRLPRRPVLLWPLLFITVYLLFMVQMGRAQTFYMISVLPFFAILAADMLGDWLRRSRWLFAAAALALAGNAAADLYRSYPDMHLNGYQWTGERYIAHRASLGYKGLAQTPSDGIQQVAQWAWQNVEPGQRVVTYMRERLAIWFLGPARPILFHVRDGFNPAHDIEEANYVLVHINATIKQFNFDEPGRRSIYEYPFDIDVLRRDFKKVFAVKRAFGVEMASVWKRRKPYAFDLQGNVLEKHEN